MPYAFSHLVFAWILVKAYTFFTKRKLSTFAWFMVLFGAILPDIDYIYQWVLKEEIHRLFTHSLLFALICFVLIYLTMNLIASKGYIRRNEVWRYIGWFMFGLFTHLLLDFIASPSAGIPFFWPYPYFFGLFTGMISFSQFAVLEMNTAAFFHMKLLIAIFDMGLGAAWMFYLLYCKKIKEF